MATCKDATQRCEKTGTSRSIQQMDTWIKTDSARCHACHNSIVGQRVRIAPPAAFTASNGEYLIDMPLRRARPHHAHARTHLPDRKADHKRDGGVASGSAQSGRDRSGDGADARDEAGGTVWSADAREDLGWAD
ncbi:hypothetical protein B0H14DRAFT_2600100 [Mycena olivaceomarginata]|nr:hypothetical protein B0H14DRAFT_2600100 [Mycena olivaceomarginata]